ncbi:MAG: cytochrome c [Betaproteobacteria bacterium]|nr:cytochrome c [Betaproteobacteria bacterium]
MKKSLGCLALYVACTGSGLAQAQFVKPEDAIKYRKASFTLLGAHFGRLAQMAQGKTPYDAKLAADSAEVLATVAKLPWAAFGEGTDKGETRAKPEIWKEAGKFKEAADKNQAELAKVVAAAKTGSLDALKAAVGPAASSCKACHESFRKD